MFDFFVTLEKYREITHAVKIIHMGMTSTCCCRSFIFYVINSIHILKEQIFLNSMQVLFIASILEHPKSQNVKSGTFSKLKSIRKIL